MYNDRFFTVILAAGGSGVRFGGTTPKQFADLGGRSVLEASAELFLSDVRVDEIIVVVPEEYVEETRLMFDGICENKQLIVVPGGSDRAASVNAGLAAASAQDGIVLVHDAARPFVPDDVVGRVLAAADEYGAAVPAVPVTDTIYETTGDAEGRCCGDVRFASGIPSRDSLRAVQTPQGFDIALLRDAHKKASEAGAGLTDDGMPVLLAGERVAVVAGDVANIKITTRDDLPLSDSGEFRVGLGFDAHRFIGDRQLILGGVTIPFEKGLAGHSDADVLTHALMDAILGALRAGDIGQRFPDTDEKYKGISSMVLLKDVVDFMQSEMYEISNCDMTLVAERPKMAPHRRAVEESIAAALGTEPENISLKATTTEKLGFTGREEGIAAEVAVLLRKTK